MHHFRCFVLIVVCGLLSDLPGHAQIDPVRRDLLQFGYNGALQGHQPLSAYAFFYHNQPDFPATNLTLRLAVAPTYLDSELGFRHLLGEYTDFGIGLAGGGYADSYVEIRKGKYITEESFLGYGGGLNASVYHLFNPHQMIPLHGVFRLIGYYSAYQDDSNTAENFQLPDNHGTFSVRTGLRFGGREPTLFPSLAMELSVWYDGQFRSGAGTYGFDDRQLNSESHNFWAEALLIYTTPGWKQNFEISLTAGTSVDADRLSAYRLGALLPLISEYPLSLPGYYYQEISAQQFVLFSANYLLPLDRIQRWNINLTAATAAVEYLPGLEQPGNWHTGVGAGILYRTDSLKFMIGYAYGVDAIRSDGRGAHSIGVLMQLDWGHARNEIFNPTTPNLWRGVQRVFGLFGG
jgi:hypothetical protein